MTTSIVPAPPAPVAARGLLRPIARPGEVIEAHKAAAELIRDALEPDRDFGIIPRTQKPTLLKPGAERLCVAFGLVPRLEVLEHEVDHDRRVEWSSRSDSGVSRGLYRYVIRCVLTRDGVEVGSGLGSCSTMESKYIRDPRSSENTVVKMAGKRALVAAVLSTLALSDRFTQDLDDAEHEPPAPKPARTPAGPPPEQEAMRAAISTEFDRLQTPPGERAEAVWRILGGRKPSSVEDLRDVLAVLKDLPAPGGAAAKPLEPEFVEDEKKEGTE